MKKNSINNGLNRERSPRGMEINRPILSRLRQEEWEQIQKIAIRENRSTSNLARILMLVGLEHYPASNQQDN